jgi:hypothetical protein
MVAFVFILVSLTSSDFDCLTCGFLGEIRQFNRAKPLVIVNSDLHSNAGASAFRGRRDREKIIALRLTRGSVPEVSLWRRRIRWDAFMLKVKLFALPMRSY